MDDLIVIRAIENCTNKPKCRDCPWKECEKVDCERVETPKSLLLEAKNIIRQKNGRIWDLLCKVEELQTELDILLDQSSSRQVKP